MSTLEPFTIAVSDEDLEDLRGRLKRTRWPQYVKPGWDYGTDPTYLRELVAYWIDRFDWRLHERRLNSFPQFLADVDGVRLHFVRQRGIGPRPMPLLLLHGWPGTFVQMLDLLPFLIDPAARGGDPSDAFDVVVVSLPGYGFSAQPTAPGMHEARMAELFHRLMTETLGFSRYAVRGGDWGGGILTHLAAAILPRLSERTPAAPHHTRARSPPMRRLPSSRMSRTFDAAARRRWVTVRSSRRNRQRSLLL